MEYLCNNAMVVGYVQSGKTSNYIGIINKATDAGYKIIIVIAGLNSSLRKQTQERIDAGYIGRSTSKGLISEDNERIGVGKLKYNKNINVQQIYAFTYASYEDSDKGDFNQQIASAISAPIGDNPIVFVIKKNKSILENLIQWLSKNERSKTIDGSPKLSGMPALIIDDEADNASVNTSKKDEEPKTINRLIRVLCNLFSQKTFIGYTATPYANLFIKRITGIEKTTTIKKKNYKIGADLFPKDFMINIKPSSNYIGTKNLFGYRDPNNDTEEEPLELFRDIDDHTSPKNKNDLLPTYLPESLKKAIHAFMLTCAIRSVRGDGDKDNSMLVHFSRYVNFIQENATLINKELSQYKDDIASENVELLQKLQDLYEKDFVPTTLSVKDSISYQDNKISSHNWVEVHKELKKTTPQIEVSAVHGNMEELNYNQYKEGFSVIAVGGDKFSRGITLEGLSISYYLRNSKMGDSLLQMGRWFGYRPGYVDLCRLYTTEKIYKYYRDITKIDEGVRCLFDQMALTNKSPEQFDLKVRCEPGLLKITSLNKLRHGKEIELSLSNKNIQTYEFLKTKEAIANNFNALKCLINTISLTDKHKTNSGNIKYLCFFDQDIVPLCNFLEMFETDQGNINKDVLTDYINKQHENKLIKKWNICIVNNTDKKVFIDKEGNAPKKGRKNNEEPMTYVLEVGDEKITLGCSVRNQDKQNRSGDYYFISKYQIDDFRDRQFNLEKNNFKTNKEIQAQREKEQKGLILIYALDERGTLNVDNGLPIIGYSIHFPKIEGEKS